MDGVDPRRLPAQREEQERTRLMHAAVAAEDIAWLMESPRGRRLMWTWLEFTGLYRTSFTGNSETFFKEGMRNVGLRMQSQVLEHCPERWVEMMVEAREKKA